MNIARLVASGGGAGLSPKAPGTVGSLLALILAVPLLGNPLALGAACLAASLAGLWAIPRAGGADDPGWVVIDEVAGMWITLLGLGTTPSWRGVAAAFALFRLLDITKPGPIGWADRQHGAFGVMADDVIAGVIGALILSISKEALLF